MRQRKLTFILSTVLTTATFGWIGLSVGQAQADDPAPCAAKKFDFPAVEKACASGGQKAAKDLMKDVVKKMKADGKDVNCKSCHTELKTYKNKSNAIEDLKAYL